MKEYRSVDGRKEMFSKQLDRSCPVKSRKEVTRAGKGAFATSLNALLHNIVRWSHFLNVFYNKTFTFVKKFASNSIRTKSAQDGTRIRYDSQALCFVLSRCFNQWEPSLYWGFTIKESDLPRKILGAYKKNAQ